MVQADGSEEHRRPNAPADEPSTIVERSISTTTVWDPPLLQPGGSATLLVSLPGAELGDVVYSGHSGLQAGVGHLIQISAVSGDDVAEVLMHNVGPSPVDIGSGRLRVVAMKMS